MHQRRRGFFREADNYVAGRPRLRARPQLPSVLFGGAMGKGFVRHKPKKSDAKRAERSMPKPKAKPVGAGKEKPASKPPASGQAGPD